MILSKRAFRDKAFTYIIYGTRENYINFRNNIVNKKIRYFELGDMNGWI